MELKVNIQCSECGEELEHEYDNISIGSNDPTLHIKPCPCQREVFFTGLQQYIEEEYDYRNRTKEQRN